ncbi:hypothetical protein ACHQM5_018348 [Ranunculus cassubicifolius]
MLFLNNIQILNHINYILQTYFVVDNVRISSSFSLKKERLSKIQTQQKIYPQESPPDLYPLLFNTKQKKITLLEAQNRKVHSRKVTRSVLGNRNLSLGNSEDAATDSMRVLLERFYEQTQRFETDSEGIQIEFDVENLGLDLEAALEVLKNKEDDLKEAENRVLSEHKEINRAKCELKQREEEISAALLKQEKIEDGLKQANGNLAAQAKQLEDLKLVINERDQEINGAHSSLSLKEVELNQMRNKLIKKTEESSRMESAIKLKDELLYEANEVLRKQAIEVQELKKAITVKKKELKEFAKVSKIEKEKLKFAEAKLEQQTVVWLSAQGELKKLTEEAQRQMGKSTKDLEELTRVKSLLTDVRFQLVFSQRSIALARGKIEEQEKELAKQLGEVEEQKRVMKSHMKRLNEAEIELASEQLKLRESEARNIELEKELSMEKELIEKLQIELSNERSCLEVTTKQVKSLQHELDKRNLEFKEAQNQLQIKESELVEARVQIRQLQSEQAHIKLVLEQKDSDIFDAQIKFTELNGKIAELRDVLNSREKELAESHEMLQEKENYFEAVKHELSDTKLKFLEATNAAEHIANLTTQMVDSIGKDDIKQPQELETNESAQPEVEAATSALERIADMCKELVKRAECFAEARMQVAQLSALSEKLVEEAGVGAMA